MIDLLDQAKQVSCYAEFNFFVQIHATAKDAQVSELVGECKVSVEDILGDKNGGSFILPLENGTNQEQKGSGLIKFEQGKILPYHPKPILKKY